MTLVARALAITGLIVALAMAALLIGGYNVVVQSREQSEYNESLLRVVLATSGCTVADSPDTCRQRQADRAAAEGAARVADVDCRIRLALAGQPPPTAARPCVPRTENR